MSNVIITLTPLQAEALRDVLESAERGRDDFDYLAGLDRGDYSPEDVQAAKDRHAAELDVEASILSQLDNQTPIVSKVIALRQAWEEASTAVSTTGLADLDGAIVREQDTWDALIDFIEANDLNGSVHDPRVLAHTDE